jgi:hypothetical protein
LPGSLAPRASSALDLFSAEGRIARRGQKQVARTVMQHMVAGACWDSRSRTRQLIMETGAKRSMDFARELQAYANDEPMCVEIAGIWVGSFVQEEIGDAESVSRALA